MEFRHVVEVHAVDAGDQSHRKKHDRHRGQRPHDLVGAVSHGGEVQLHGDFHVFLQRVAVNLDASQMLGQVVEPHTLVLGQVDAHAPAPGADGFQVVFAEQFEPMRLTPVLQQFLPVVEWVFRIEQRVLQPFQSIFEFVDDGQIAVDHDVENGVHQADRRAGKTQLGLAEFFLHFLERRVFRGMHRDQKPVEHEERRRLGDDQVGRRLAVLGRQALEDQHVVVFGAVEVRGMIAVEAVGDVRLVNFFAAQTLGPARPVARVAAREIQPDETFGRQFFDRLESLRNFTLAVKQINLHRRAPRRLR